MLRLESAKLLVEKLKSGIWDQLDTTTISKDFVTHFIYIVVAPIRQFTNHVTAIKISKEARELITHYGVEIRKHGDLNHVNSKIIKEHAALTLDHLYPINQQVRRYLNNEITIDELFELSKLQALIVKEEGRKMIKNKFKDKRSIGWEAAYKLCKIDLEDYTPPEKIR